MTLLVAVVLAGLLAGVAGDRLYARRVEARHRAWEAGVERDADGVRAGCRAFTVGDGEPALLLVHGFGDSPALFRKMAPALAERGYTCRALRLPGFAEPMPAYAGGTRAAWRAALAGELDALRAAHRPVVVVAHSLGGLVAVRHLSEAPEAADGLVLLAPLLKVSGARSPVLPPRAWFALADTFAVRTRIVENPFAGDGADGRDRFIPVEIYREMFALMDEAGAAAGGLRTPLLVVLAGKDEVVDNRAARAFWTACPAESKTLAVVPGAAHPLPLEPAWPELVETVDAFARTARAPP